MDVLSPRPVRVVPLLQKNLQLHLRGIGSNTHPAEDRVYHDQVCATRVIDTQLLVLLQQTKNGDSRCSVIFPRVFVAMISLFAVPHQPIRAASSSSLGVPLHVMSPRSSSAFSAVSTPCEDSSAEHHRFPARGSGEGVLNQRVVPE